MILSHNTNEKNPFSYLLYIISMIITFNMGVFILFYCVFISCLKIIKIVLKYN